MSHIAGALLVLSDRICHTFHMEIIETIKDADLGLPFADGGVYQERRASRAVVFDEDGKIALLYAAKKHFHKLPGGGIEGTESIEEALRREVSEEIGCTIRNIRELGIVEEFRNKFMLHQLSYCFLADLAGEKGVPHFEPSEIEDGFVPVWLDIEEAIRTLEGETDIEDYEGKFVRVRDLAFLQKAAQG